LKWFIFSWRLLFLPTSKMKNPDIIIASPTSPLFIISAYRVSKKLNSKLDFRDKDIWPLTLIEIGWDLPKISLNLKPWPLGKFG